eukprot:CAMPEP_0181206118 /NCGR_PEP_ID=MMETSP1096-20121128/20858_1 /TAXON_ID=156174 ORGANISM="Chrysochromulina ericina, Strain CCMP281" /NCGR_SAMPLE_ID=MMETSP1096 /ASSEMBLY_ACC=CAM_ASM_000453 /LENGTH=37 /DNA_ID= /DNA_START= /DNA_END= /DNA_ORIENTATION=
MAHARGSSWYQWDLMPMPCMYVSAATAATSCGGHRPR